MQLTDDDLRKLSEHVLYEIEMLFGAAELLEWHVTRDGFNLPWAIHMAQIESFAIHARTLMDFLFNERSRSPRSKAATDGFAADYFKPGDWRGLCPSRETTLDRVTDQVGQQVAHISYPRASHSAKRPRSGRSLRSQPRSVGPCASS
jgi:hypothetical protein